MTGSRLWQHALGSMTPHADEAERISALGTLRRRGVILLAIMGWASLLAILFKGIAGGSFSWPVLAVGAASNLGPSLMALRHRHDAEARMIVGTLAAIMPALLVYGFKGDPWQMDAHMYFFVALASLAMLCDWRPIALASAMIAVHHLILELAAPAWVFDGGGNIGRVLFHGAAVAFQYTVLAYVASQLEALLEAQDQAVITSEKLAAEAEEARQRADKSLAAMREAEAQAERARRDNRDMERRHAETRERELIDFASEFERSVAGIAVAIESAAIQLAASSTQLDDVSAAAGREAHDVAANAVDAMSEIRRAAEAVFTLGASIGSIASAAEQQRSIAAIGRDKGERSRLTVSALSVRVEQVGGLIDQVRGIAARTNLLALNATIEASRAGEAGRGFVVVANEVKGLAAETAQMTDRIVDLLDGIRGSAEASTVDVGVASDAIAEVSQAAISIAAETEDQRRLASDLERSAGRAAGNASSIEQRIEDLASRVTAAVTLSSEVRRSSGALLDSARELRRSSNGLIGHLRGNGLDSAPAQAA